MKTVISQNAFEWIHPGDQPRNGSFVSALSETGSSFENALSEFIVEIDNTDALQKIGLTGILSILISGILNLILVIS